MKSTRNIKEFILHNLSQHKKDIILAAITHFGISRQAVLKHMHALIKDNIVVAEGKTRDRTYHLRPQVNFNSTLQLNSEFLPYEIVNEKFLVHLKSLPKNIYGICEYSLEALLNNIVDHAEASNMYFKLFLTLDDLHIIIRDNGNGLFEKIKSKLNLRNIQSAVLEIGKGKVTTDPESHSGYELYTVIHLFDKVKIDANGISLTYEKENNLWGIEISEQKKGTRIHLQINPESKRTCEQTFLRIFNNNNRVSIPINLLKRPGNNSVNSRLQANCIFNNIDNINEIEFDFNNINLIGPAFADELVRKTKLKNKTASIKWINCNETIDLLMKHALSRLN